MPKKGLDLNQTTFILYYLAWLQALVATAGSLFFSEVMSFTPCKLCWYQRILMYPLVFVIGTGLIKKDKNLPLYVLPLSLTGMLVALYHNLIYYGIINERLVRCASDVPCTTRFFAWFGFITIPLLSLTAFTVITALMFLSRKTQKKTD